MKQQHKSCYFFVLIKRHNPLLSKNWRAERCYLDHYSKINTGSYTLQHAGLRIPKTQNNTVVNSPWGVMPGCLKCDWLTPFVIFHMVLVLDGIDLIFSLVGGRVLCFELHYITVDNTDDLVSLSCAYPRPRTFQCLMLC